MFSYLILTYDSFSHTKLLNITDEKSHFASRIQSYDHLDQQTKN